MFSLYDIQNEVSHDRVAFKAQNLPPSDTTGGKEKPAPMSTITLRLPWKPVLDHVGQPRVVQNSWWVRVVLRLLVYDINYIYNTKY